VQVTVPLLTLHKQTLSAMDKSDKRLKALVENSDEIISLLDEKLTTVFRSASAVRITGWTDEEYDAIASTSYIHPDDAAALQILMAEAVSTTAASIPLRFRAMHKNGHYLWLQGTVTNLLHDPDIASIVMNLRDCSQQIEAEQKIIKANRLYFFISQVNQMIVRTTDEATLFREACNIAVELGQFRMAWIGIIDETTKMVVPVTHAGEETGYLSQIKPVSVADVPAGKGPTGTALREDRYIVCNDIKTAPEMAPWREAALERGYHSSIALPIRKFGKVVGVFSVYASEKNFFDTAEIALLEEATGDVAYAMENLENEKLRKKAEAELQESKLRYQTLAEVSPVGIFHTDAAGYTTYVSPGWCKISGMPYREALGNGWLNAVHEQDKDALSSGWEAATGKQQLSISEYRFIRPDGSIAWVIGQATPERNAAGAVVGYVGTITDITERRIAEEKIRSSEKKLLKAQEIGKLGYWQREFNSDVIWASKEAMKIYGFPAVDGEIPRDAIMACIVDKEIVRQASYNLVNYHTDYNIEVRIQPADGSPMKYIASMAELERDENGKAVRVVGTLQDITDRKMAEAELAKVYREKETALNRINDAVVSVDNHWNYTFLNTAALATHPLGREETLGKNIWEVHPEMKRTVFWDKYHEAMNTGKVTEVESYYAPMNTWFVVRIYPSADGLTIFYRDITDNKKSQDLLRANEEKIKLIYNTTRDSLFLIAVKNHRYYFTSVNQSFLEATGLKEEQVVGKFVEEIIPQPSLGLVLDHYQAAITSKQTVQWEEVSDYPTGTKTGVVSVTPVFDSHGNCNTLVGSVHDITGRKKAEAELRANEEKRRLIMTAALDAIICIDTKGIITFWNPQAEKIFGWKEHEVMGKLLSSIIIPAPYAAMHDRGMEHYLKTGKGPALNVLLELTAVNSSGNQFPVELTVLPIKQGGEEFFCAFIRDITERKQAERAIRESEERYRKAQAIGRMGHWELDLRNQSLTWSDEIYRIFEVEKDAYENLYDGFVSLMHPDDMEAFTQKQAAALSGKDTLDLIHRIITPKGKVKYMHELGRLLYNEAGEAVFFAGTVQDVTDMVKARDEIINEKNLSDSIINSLPGVFYLYNRSFKFLRWNKNFETVTQYSAAEIATMQPLDFFEADEKEKVGQKIFNTFSYGEDTVQAGFLQKSGNKVPYYFTGKVVEYRGEECLLGVGIDFSERMKAQEKIRETSEQLRLLTAHLQSVREEERKRIGREIHDELGQQLTAVKMDVVWIDKKITEEQPLLKTKLKNVIALLDGSHQSIRRILSELRPGILEDHGLLEALKWLGRQLTENRGIPVEFNCSEKEVKVSGSIATCIFRVYQEALTNISRYAAPEKVVGSLSIVDHTITVIISDNGKGFDPAIVEVNKSFGIMGMKERVISLGGTFELLSSPGNGTSIIMSLPL
jgi:PAS domain S-box-containing protein